MTALGIICLVFGSIVFVLLVACTSFFFGASLMMKSNRQQAVNPPYAELPPKFTRRTPESEVR